MSFRIIRHIKKENEMMNIAIISFSIDCSISRIILSSFRTIVFITCILWFFIKFYIIYLRSVIILCPTSSNLVHEVFIRELFSFYVDNRFFFAFVSFIFRMYCELFCKPDHHFNLFVRGYCYQQYGTHFVNVSTNFSPTTVPFLLFINIYTRSVLRRI